MATWESGWKTARTRGGGQQLYWRGYLMLTLSEAEARRFKAAVDRFAVTPGLILQAALRAWLDQLDRGEVSSPLAGLTEGKHGGGRQKAPYHLRR